MIGYLVNTYPAPSHTFIRNEILALEALGVPVARFAMRGWDAVAPDPRDVAEKPRTRYLLRGGAIPLGLALVKVALTRPGRFVAALDALRTLHGGIARRLIYLAEACLLLGWTRAAGVGHLHVHFGTNGVDVALLARKLGGPSYSFTVHGPEEFDKPLQTRLREKVRDAAFVVAITSFCRSQLYRWSDLADWPKIAVVHCGVDDAFLATPFTPPPQARRLVCVGRLCEQKGQLLLIDALADLHARGVGATLTLAGDGPMRPEIEAAIRRHDLSDAVTITGWIGSEQVADLLRQSDALVLASFAEGLPIVLMEAMALGRPPITTAIAGVPELVRDGSDGLIVPAGDAPALTDALERFFALDTEAVERMAHSARARVRKRHGLATEAARLAALFNRPAPPPQ